MTGVTAPGQEWLARDLLRVEEILLEKAGASGHALVAESATHLIKAGGKRLRPALVLVSARAGGNDVTEATDLAAAAVELVHLATLYHDDVLDGTETRRGAPTVHSKWGTQVAVLAGDYLFACGSALGARAGGEVPGILAAAIEAVCQGQIVETDSLGDTRRTAEQYLETIRSKTAALFRAACDLGASTGGASPEHRAALTEYGENLGLAFQLVDDVLDLVGDPRVTGKEPGTDLREGVFTMPVLIAAERDPSIPGLLSESRELDRVLPRLQASGGIEASIDRARDHADRARAALMGLPDAEWRSVLEVTVDGVLGQVLA